MDRGRYDDGVDDDLEPSVEWSWTKPVDAAEESVFAENFSVATVWTYVNSVSAFVI